MGLTAKQERFCEEYVVDFNATQAAIRAGYSEKRASEQAYQLLQKTTVQNKVKELQSELRGRTMVRAEDVIKEFIKVGFANMSDFASWNGSEVSLKSSEELEDINIAAVSEVSSTSTTTGTNVKIKLHNKLSALESLGKHLGIFEKDNSQKKPDQPDNITVVIKGESKPPVTSEEDIEDVS